MRRGSRRTSARAVLLGRTWRHPPRGRPHFSPALLAPGLKCGLDRTGWAHWTANRGSVTRTSRHVTRHVTALDGRTHECGLPRRPRRYHDEKNVEGGHVVRLVFVDMDDTFVTPDKVITPENLRILDVAHERGVQFVPCTGRSVRGLPQQLVEHPSVRFAVCSGGALVYDLRAGGAGEKNGEVVHSQPIEKGRRAVTLRRRARPAHHLRPHGGGRGPGLVGPLAALLGGGPRRRHARDGALPAHPLRRHHGRAHRAHGPDLPRQRALRGRCGAPGGVGRRGRAPRALPRLLHTGERGDHGRPRHQGNGASGALWHLGVAVADTVAFGAPATTSP